MLNKRNIFLLMMNKLKNIIPLLLLLSISSAPVFAWGGGDCPFSRKGANQDSSTEKVEETEASKRK